MITRFFIFFINSLGTTNHRTIGQLYILFGGFSALIGTLLSLAIRYQLLVSGSASDFSNLSYFNPSVYNTIVTMHGILMIFMFVMPVLIGGFGNFFVPVMLGAPEMAFPRLNNLSF